MILLILHLRTCGCS